MRLPTTTEFLMFFLFQTAAIVASEGNWKSRYFHFKLQTNTQLVGYVVERFDSRSLLSCSRECVKNLWCSSTNFKLSSEKDSEGACELNEHDIAVVDEPIKFVDQKGVVFSLLLKGCLFSGCFNGGSCLPNGEKQTYSCSCKLPWTGDRCDIKMTATTCKEIYDNKFANDNRAYPLQVDSRSFLVYCHLTSLGACGEGGWTLVMKIDGSKLTFHYDANIWSNKETLSLDGGKTGFDSQETKLPTYWNTSFTRICLGMKIGEQDNFIPIDRSASSLYSLIADGTYRATSLGRDTWKKLIGSQASLQLNCNKEGFNVRSFRYDRSKARIGIISNNERDCGSADSRIGFGTGGSPSNELTCGNRARFADDDNGDKFITAMGYILVQ